MPRKKAQRQTKANQPRRNEPRRAASPARASRKPRRSAESNPERERRY